MATDDDDDNDVVSDEKLRLRLIRSKLETQHFARVAVIRAIDVASKRVEGQECVMALSKLPKPTFCESLIAHLASSFTCSNEIYSKSNRRARKGKKTEKVTNNARIVKMKTMSASDVQSLNKEVKLSVTLMTPVEMFFVLRASFNNARCGLVRSIWRTHGRFPSTH